MWHGLFNILEKCFRKKDKKSKQKPLAAALSHIYTLLVVMIGWVLFRSPNLSQALQYLSGMFGLVPDCRAIYSYGWFLDLWNICVLAVALLWSTPALAKLGNGLAGHLPEKLVTVLKYIGLLLMLTLCIMRVTSGTYSAFIYFQF